MSTAFDLENTVSDAKDPEETNNIVSWVRGLNDLPIPFYFATAIVLGSVLFAPDPYAEGLGFVAFLDHTPQGGGVSLRPFVGIAFYITLVFGFTKSGVLFYEIVRKRYEESKESLRREKRMHALTSDEKKVLLKFVPKGSRVAHFPSELEGVVYVLIREMILEEVAIEKRQFQKSFHIQPWAWDYLLANPALLDLDEAKRNNVVDQI